MHYIRDTSRTHIEEVRGPDGTVTRSIRLERDTEQKREPPNITKYVYTILIGLGTWIWKLN